MLAALALAIVLWVVVKLNDPQDERQAISDVPIRVQLLDLQWAVAGAPAPASATVEVVGPVRQLMRLGDQHSIMVPVTAVSSTDTSLVINHDWVRLEGREGEEVEVVDMEPDEVSITFEPMMSVDVPVTPTAAGTPRGQGTLVGPLTANPPSIRVRGPASKVANLRAIRLDPVDLSRIARSQFVRVGVGSGLAGELISFAPDSVDVWVELSNQGESGER